MKTSSPLLRLVLRVGRPLLTLCALGLAVWLVRHEIGRLRLADVLAAIAATPWWAIAASVGLTAASYGCLVAAEWCAFRYVGKPQAWRTMALRAFAAHALASNLGFGLVSGAAVRLRLYRGMGLGPKDLTGLAVRISTAIFLSGVVTLGLTLLLVAALAGPSKLHLAAAAPGLLLLAPAAFWFIDLGPLGASQPSILDRKGRALALGVSIGDWVCSGAALFALSHHGMAGLPVFLAVFVSSSLVGSLVGLPAAIGLLDAAVIGSAVLAGGTHETAAALLLYRVVYFLAPLTLALGGAAVAATARLAARIRSS